MGVVGVVLGYFFVTRAIDTGSWWEYLGTVIFTVLGVKLIIRAVKQH
jgi:predicted tellurium resistance membrane protein TerC